MYALPIMLLMISNLMYKNLLENMFMEEGDFTLDILVLYLDENEFIINELYYENM